MTGSLDNLSHAALQNLCFEEWKELLLNFPQFAPQYEWDKLGPGKWKLLPFVPQQFASRNDLVQQEGYNWAKILDNRQDLFRVKCNWSEFTGLNWAWLLRWKSEYADLCDWKKLSESDWLFLLSTRPQYFIHFHLDNLCERRWLELLNKIPQLADRINWRLLTTSDWLFVLSHFPEYSSRGDFDWNTLSNREWINLLVKQPRFGDKCDFSKFDGSDWLLLLLKHPGFAERCNWDKLDERPSAYALRAITGRQGTFFWGPKPTCWSLLLSRCPQYAKYRNWDKVYGDNWREFQRLYPNAFDDANRIGLDGNNWVDVLIAHPEFANLCEWRKLDDHNWLSLLTAQPQFADKYDWNYGKGDGIRLRAYRNSYGSDWIPLLIAQPQFADKCDFSEFDGSNWTDLLLKRPQFANKCDWSKLNGDNWASLLVKKPQFSNLCDWCELKAWNWLKLLTVQPQFADKCNWKQIDTWDETCDLNSMRSTRLFRMRSLLDKHKRPNYSTAWVAFLSEQPQFADKCDWSRLNGWGWAMLLVKQPQFAYKCDWSKLDGWNWASLLAKQPQFADKCDWNKLDSRDMVSLLVEQPQFATKCAWSKLDGWDWAYLLAEQPQFADKCDWNKLYIVYPDVVCNGIPEPYEEQQVFCWAKLLQAQPQFEDRCDWGRLTGKDWALLLRDCPQYADKCDWSKLYENSVVKVECDPAYCEDCSLSQECKRGYKEQPFSNWTVLLDKQPQFADKCDWSRLNESDQASQTIAKLKGVELSKEPYDCYRDYMMQRKSPKKHLDLARDGKLLASHDAWANTYNHTYYSGSKAVKPSCSGYEMMLWLSYHYKSAKTEYWGKLNGSDWVGVLRWKPNLATHCDWSKLAGGDWSILLSFYPEFADYCDWGKTEQWSGRDWAMVIRNSPKLATKERLDKMNGEDLVVVLTKQPQLADKCDLSKLSGWNWASLLQVQPALVGFCDWSKFSAHDWLSLLKQQQQFANHRDWKTVSGRDLIKVLVELPDFEKYCDLEKLYESTGSGEDEHIWFAELLGGRSHKGLRPSWNIYDIGCDILDKCNWRRFSEQDKKWLMRHFLDFKYSHVTSVTRRIPVNCRLTRIENEEAEEKIFKKDLDWGDLSGNDIVQLLGTFPQLSDRCDLTRLTVGNWVDLLERQPAFAAQCSHLQKEIEAERQKRKEESAWELEKYRQERDAEAAELSHKFDLECDDPEYADMEYWNTH